MDSQSAMLEIASGSSSSESIVNISRSGASSISTSTTNNTTTTTVEKLNSEIEKLREDKKILEGRIRGYRTLSDLLVDCRRENEQLKAQLKSLTAQQKLDMSGIDIKPSVGSPFSLVSMQAAQQQDVRDLAEPSMNRLSLQDQKPSNTSTLTSNQMTNSTGHLSCSDPPVLNPPVSGPPSSLQETVSPPTDRDETKLISLTSPTGAGAKPAWTAPESEHRQESLGPISSKSQPASHPPGSLTNFTVVDKAEASSSPDHLQLDSDKYDDPTYQKLGPQLGMGHAGLTSSMYAAGGSGGAESRPTDFPSLSSGMSSGMAQPPSQGSHGSIFNPPYMAMMHQSHMGPTSDNQNSGLAAEVENITERLNSEPGDTSPAIAFQMHQIAERISKVEQKERDQKRLIGTLMRENQDLKRQLKEVDNTFQAEAVRLREQNTRLMQQVKGQRQSEETTVVKSKGSHGDWVHVERPVHLGDSQTGSEQSLVDRVRKLEQEKAELQRANSNWKSQWEKMEQSHQVKLSELRSTLGITEQELTTHKSRLAELTSDVESRMLEMKRHVNEEENLKEEAQHQQRLAERRNSELQDQLTEIRTQLSDTARDKQGLAAELNIVKAHFTGQQYQTNRASDVTGTGSTAALTAEIAMLKEQLKVFAEDFEHEREDRTTAQSARDTAKKNAEAVTRHNQALSSQVKHLQKQIKDRDDTISWTLRQNETLQRQATEYKKKLAAEWEEKQGLQRMLTLAQRQQPVNPYLTQETQHMYRPAPIYQPPPPARPSPYYAGQSTSQSLSRPTAAAMSPEHLPGAWTCSACTYINYPGRTVCESCGLVNSPRSHPERFGFPSQDTIYGSSEHALLMSRGGDQNQRGTGPTNGDLVVDCGGVPWGPTPH